MSKERRGWFQSTVPGPCCRTAIVTCLSPLLYSEPLQGKTVWEEWGTFPHDSVSAALNLWAPVLILDWLFRSKTSKYWIAPLQSETSGVCRRSAPFRSPRTGSRRLCLRSALCSALLALGTDACPIRRRPFFWWWGLDYRPAFTEAAYHPTGASLAQFATCLNGNLSPYLKKVPICGTEILNKCGN